MELNWSKTVQLRISTNELVCRPGGGEPIACAREAVYLGGMLTCDGKAQRELNRRLGEGRYAFKQLHRLWAHSGITRHRKLYLYMSCIASKFLYSLESVWMLKADRAKLDAFHHRCLRMILRIPPSFVSHVPNLEVLTKSGLPLLSVVLERRQTSLYQRIVAMPDDSFIKSLVCFPSGQPKLWSAQRRRGRPRQMWNQSVYNLVSKLNAV